LFTDNRKTGGRFTARDRLPFQFNVPDDDVWLALDVDPVSIESMRIETFLNVTDYALFAAKDLCVVGTTTTFSPPERFEAQLDVSSASFAKLFFEG
jgi:hypothetical protein